MFYLTSTDVDKYYLFSCNLFNFTMVRQHKIADRYLQSTYLLILCARDRKASGQHRNILFQSSPAY